MKILLIVVHATVIVVLTVLTQVGGAIYLVVLLLGQRLSWTKGIRIVSFIGLYLLSSLILVPFLAPMFGRTALPLTGNLRPLNFGTCLLNRHYVRPQMKIQIQRIADEMNQKFERTKTNYLDANFPFFNGFPLLPHLSHNDGRKLDLAFYYKQGDEKSNGAPSFIGYGVYEDPVNKEQNYPQICAERGNWQYGFMSTIVPQWNKNKYELDVQRTRELIKLLALDDLTSKIFIEPHLKQRWRLSRFDNIRFHGCQAVRHDDHIHTQIN